MSAGLIYFCIMAILLSFLAILSTHKFPFSPIQYSISANNFEVLKVQIEEKLLNNYFKSGSEKLYEDMGTVYGYSMRGFMRSEDFYLINMTMQLNENGYKSIKSLNREILSIYPPVFITRATNTIFMYCFDCIHEEEVASITPSWSFSVMPRSSNTFDFPPFVSFYTKNAYSINFNNEPTKMISHSWNKQFELISSIFEQKI